VENAIVKYPSSVNYFLDLDKLVENIHVLTVLPGFMDTKMTADLDLPKPLTASAETEAAQTYQ
jgi:NAD(P)-dependent dehydrogenase (short-subunit alcohol dehydrogenase family)